MDWRIFRIRTEPVTNIKRLYIKMNQTGKKVINNLLQYIQYFFRKQQTTRTSIVHFLVCQFIANGVTVVVDLTKRLGDAPTRPQKYFESYSIPFFKVDMPIDALLRSVDALLQVNNGSNGFLIFTSKLAVNRGVNTILGTTIIRYAFLHYSEQEELIREKFEYRVPSAVALLGSETQLRQFVTKEGTLVKNRTEWIFLFNEFVESPAPKFDSIRFPYFRGYLPVSACCSHLINIKSDVGTGSGRGCGVSSCRDLPSHLFLRRLAYLLSQALREVDPTGRKTLKIVTCSNTDQKGSSSSDKQFSDTFATALQKNSGEALLTAKDSRISFAIPVVLEDFVNGAGRHVGDYTLSKGLDLDPKFIFRTRKRYFRIGIVESSPWTMWDKERNQWEGYCIELTAGIARKMDFEYDLILSKEFGKRIAPHGRWNGLTGDLIHGVR